MIRTARKGDAESIRKLAQQSWISTYSPYLGEDVVREFVARSDFYSPGELHARMEEETGIVLVAEDQEDGVIGYTYLNWDSEADYINPDEADLRHIYLHPGHYGRGLGTRLLEAGIEQLPDRIHRLKVLFHPKNDGAREFYEAKGFTKVGLLDLDPTKVGMPSSNVDPPEMYVRDL
ncbi:GNAT family N-acetyltransferase [Halogranum rubrum]|uniref:GNAT family N-acetyltransferase n=1 Tax=Halogranum rubrum TaxID=553466 RepID=UPI0012F9A51E|nr:GNAT family N-acetyltransferase [Halogranum salarium]